MNEKIKEFIELGYTIDSLGELNFDIPINRVTLFRIRENQYNIIFLDNGSSISFDYDWISFFKQLGDHYKHLEDLSFGDKFVDLMLKVASSMNYIRDNNEWLGYVIEACSIGTEEFRKNYPELNFKPFKYKQLLDTSEL